MEVKTFDNLVRTTSPPLGPDTMPVLAPDQKTFENIPTTPTPLQFGGMIDFGMQIDANVPEMYRAEAARMKNAYAYSHMLNIAPEVAYDMEPSLNEKYYGSGTTSDAAWAKTQQRLISMHRDKDTIVDNLKRPWWGVLNARQEMAKTLAGLGLALEESNMVTPWDEPIINYFEPAMRWWMQIPEDLDLNTALRGISEAVVADIQQTQEDAPERGLTSGIDPDAGYIETLAQVVQNPARMLQGLIESSPLIIEGIVGTAAAGPAGSIFKSLFD